MNANERWDNILKLLENSDFLSVEELVLKLDISPATVRRDIKKMEQNFLLTRVRGGVTRYDEKLSKRRIEQDYIKHKNKESGLISDYIMKNRLEEEKDKKIRIAKKAAEQIEDGDSIFISASSTTFYMINYITAKNITIITDGVPQLQVLAEKGIETFVLEGHLDTRRGIIVLSDYALNKLSTLNFNKSFIGVRGVNKVSGFTTTNMLDYHIKRLIVDVTEKTYVLADSTKLNTNCLASIAKLEELTLITDDLSGIDWPQLKSILAD